ncbi:DUF1631 domain-containing protein [Massilia sp. R798]|uniref:DUF1631 domain-containing protein n=2 Tax=Massilia soli TaxID=2792854 RepID=A0ABS7STV9_9BURK|nr:DUF1631 domain-containing protein [Massilia soli]
MASRQSEAALPQASGAKIRQDLLEKLAGIVSSHVNDNLMAVINRMIAELLDATAASADGSTMFQRVKSGNLLKENSYAFFHLACQALADAARTELVALAPVPVKSAASPIPLSLVSLEEMDNQVTFEGVSRPFDVANSDALAMLNVRLGHMLERDVLRMNQNPFRPQVFLMALQQAWIDFEPERAGHALIVPMLRPGMLFEFAPMYEALNLAMLRKGVLPGSVDSYRIQKTDNAAAAKAARAAEKAALSRRLQDFFKSGPEADDGIPLIPDLPSMPKGSGGWRPSTAAGFDTPFVPPVEQTRGGFLERGAVLQPATSAGGFAPASGDGAGAQAVGAGGFAPAGLASGAGHAAGVGGGLLGILGEMQKRMPPMPASGMASASDKAGAPAHNVFYLPRLKESLPQGSLSRGDEGTIDLLSRIFETVFLDDSIPAEIRDLIQFLQIPVLKAALSDKNFFFEEAHPARRMIDLLSRMGWEQRKHADDPLFQAMRRNVDLVGRDADREQEAFAEAVADLEASIAADESITDSDIAGPIAKALKQEKSAEANRSARVAVAMRIGGNGAVDIVDNFLEKKWTTVLTVAYTVEDDKPGAVANATRTMDDLLWSVKPKVTTEQRKELIGKLPGLLTTLNQWLDVIKWKDADRLQFFAGLAECHASIVRAPLDLSPERQLEIAVEVAQQDAIRRMEKEQAAAALEQEASADEAVITVDGLERGMWLEFVQPDESVRKVKLAWVSPLRSLYIFSTGARQEAFSLQSEALAQACREGKARVIQDSGVVARVLSEAMNDSAGAVLSA